MFLHIGGDRVVPVKNIIAILDMKLRLYPRIQKISWLLLKKKVSYRLCPRTYQSRYNN